MKDVNIANLFLKLASSGDLSPVQPSRPNRGKSKMGLPKLSLHPAVLRSVTSVRRKISTVYGKLHAERLLLVQLSGLVVALVGVGMYSVPIALILGGVILIVAVERQP